MRGAQPPPHRRRYCGVSISNLWVACLKIGILLLIVLLRAICIAPCALHLKLCQQEQLARLACYIGCRIGAAARVVCILGHRLDHCLQLAGQRFQQAIAGTIQKGFVHGAAIPPARICPAVIHMEMTCAALLVIISIIAQRHLFAVYLPDKEMDGFCTLPGAVVVKPYDIGLDG